MAAAWLLNVMAVLGTLVVVLGVIEFYAPISETILEHFFERRTLVYENYRDSYKEFEVDRKGKSTSS